jgi:hypothetical protein
MPSRSLIDPSQPPDVFEWLLNGSAQKQGRKWNSHLKCVDDGGPLGLLLTLPTAYSRAHPAFHLGYLYGKGSRYRNNYRVMGKLMQTTQMLNMALMTSYLVRTRRRSQIATLPNSWPFQSTTHLKSLALAHL